MFLQQIGLLPDNMIILTTLRNIAEQRVGNKLPSENKEEWKNLVKLSIDETELNLTAVKEVYKGFYCEINTSENKTSSYVDDIAVSFYLNSFCLILFM
jgi:hypothetical protein